MAPPASIPPALPPSVEEAYRRKCLQLKQRTKEVEDTNDAARVRLARLRRGVEKLRLERAFLLEQLAKRTSTNVEDSEGSPSPPPTPQDKPLRSKRGHRKPSIVATGADPNGPPPTFINQNAHNLSPSSDAFSHSVAADASQKDKDKDGAASSKSVNNGPNTKPSRSSSSSGAAKKPTVTGFELYCEEKRPALMTAHSGELSLDEELELGWKNLSESQQDEYKAREKAEQERVDIEAAAAAAAAEEEEEEEEEAEEEARAVSEARAEEKAEKEKAAAKSEAEETPARDEDVEMSNDD